MTVTYFTTLHHAYANSQKIFFKRTVLHKNIAIRMRKPHNTGRTANSTILKNLKFQITTPKQTQPGSHRKCEL